MRKRFTKQTTLEFETPTLEEDNGKNYCTVTQITNYIKQKILSDEALSRVFVKGEISNYKTYSKGHSYFDLKDKQSKISCVLFCGNKYNLNFEPKDGMKVIIEGNIDVYNPHGCHKLYAHNITEAGIGDLYIAFQQLKEKLSKEGLFDESHKKEIAKYPKRIGVVTSPTGAAIRDIITTIKRRYPICQVILFPSLVQGNQAADEIKQQIEHAQDYNLDTLIVGRGGGSIEDLWSFNDENVAYAIYNSDVPVISAVGHEIDYTIADFVADLRAATPTAAAEFAVPDISEVIFRINQLNDRITNNINDRIIENRMRLDVISKKSIFKNPQNIYNYQRMELDHLIGRFENASKDIIHDNKNRLFRLEHSYVLKNPQSIIKDKKERYVKNFSKLEVLNPLLTLKRGYAIAKMEDTVISSSKDVKSGDNLKIKFDDGTINTKVI